MDFLRYVVDKYNDAIAQLTSNLVLSHRDLDPKNVLWNGNTFFIIDWESTDLIHPTYDLINTAVHWSNIEQEFKQHIFTAMIYAYQDAGATLNSKVLEQSLYATFNIMHWLIYNMQRACSTSDQYQKIMSE